MILDGVEHARRGVHNLARIIRPHRTNYKARAVCESIDASTKDRRLILLVLARDHRWRSHVVEHQERDRLNG